MRKPHGQRAFTMALVLLAATFAARAAELEEHLDFLQPFLNTTWVGGYVDSPQDSDIQVTMRWDPILEGKVVRRTIDVPAIPYAAETYFYWDRQEERVAFLTLNTRGITSSGTAAKDGRTVTLRGRIFWPERIMEFRTVVEVLADGKLKDLYYRLENGEWIQGHHQEFSAVPPGEESARP